MSDFLTWATGTGHSPWFYAPLGWAILFTLVYVSRTRKE